MGFGTFMFLQVVSMAMFMAWYARRHPSDAMQMFMKARAMMFGRKS